MNRASKYIYNFLHNHPGLYVNPQGIKFFLNNDDSVILNYVITNHPLEQYFVFGLIYTSNNFNGFIRDFEINGTKQLKALPVDHLWQMYYKGHAEFYCSVVVEVTYTLSFMLTGNKMIVCDPHDNKFELGKILQTNTQFAAYTVQHAMLTPQT